MNFFRRAIRSVKRRIYTPQVRVTSVESVVRLGSSYGGWTFVDRPNLYEGFVLSCGLGEDASFDAELAQQYGCRIVIVDPTPRAVEHFRQLRLRCGQSASQPYRSHGTQDVRSYDLESVRDDQFTLVAKALTNHCGRVKFFAPPDVNSVSYSLVNFQNDYATNTAHIEVEATDSRSLFEETGLRDVALMKLDIEGAEIVVIPDLLKSGFRPEQILVEFDELNWPSRLSSQRFTGVHNQLIEAGYLVSHFDGRSCVSYVR